MLQNGRRSSTVSPWRRCSSISRRIQCTIRKLSNSSSMLLFWSVSSQRNIRRCRAQELWVQVNSIERMMAEAEIVNSKEEEWNGTEIFTAKGLSSAVEELALCHSDIQPWPTACYDSDQQENRALPGWLVAQAPDRKPHRDDDLAEDLYHELYPSPEHIRLSADAKYFFAGACCLSLVDPGIQQAIGDAGNDILIGDYSDAATEENIQTLQNVGSAAFAFLKLCVLTDRMSKWQFDQLVAQTIHFRVISFWRDHALPRRPQGVYGSRMTGLGVHRNIDLGMVFGIVGASIADGGRIMTMEEYTELVEPCTLINDLIDFRGDAWRNQRENVTLRGVRGCLCLYLDNLVSKCIRGSAEMVGRGMIFAATIFGFCNWALIGSGHKLREIVLDSEEDELGPPCEYKSKYDGAYEELLKTLQQYGTLGEAGPWIRTKRKDLQLAYSKYKMSSDDHMKWLADVTRIVLHPDILRRLVDVVHYQWRGDLGDVKYCK